MHERLREQAMAAWTALQAGQPNPLFQSCQGDEEIRRYLSAAEIQALMDASHHLGDAPQRAKQLAAGIIEQLE